MKRPAAAVAESPATSRENDGDDSGDYDKEHEEKGPLLRDRMKSRKFDALMSAPEGTRDFEMMRPVKEMLKAEEQKFKGTGPHMYTRTPFCKSS